jgi:hypothetical protein
MILVCVLNLCSISISISILGFLVQSIFSAFRNLRFYQLLNDLFLFSNLPHNLLTFLEANSLAFFFYGNFFEFLGKRFLVFLFVMDISNKLTFNYL